MVDATAIVLAGGRSSRFGADKLAAQLDGRSLVEHAIATVATVATEVVVVTAIGSAGTGHGRADAPGVRLIADPMPYGGPVVGLRAGAAAARSERLLVVGGDMPWLVAAVLRQLLGALDQPQTVDAVALGGDRDTGHGMDVHPLPVALRRSAVLHHARDHAARLALRGLLRDLDVSVIPAAAWRGSDPSGTTVRDVDRPEDLTLEWMGEP